QRMRRHAQPGVADDPYRRLTSEPNAIDFFLHRTGVGVDQDAHWCAHKRISCSSDSPVRADHLFAPDLPRSFSVFPSSACGLPYWIGLVPWPFSISCQLLSRGPTAKRTPSYEYPPRKHSETHQYETRHRTEA